MDHLSKEADSQINREDLQSMLSTKELYPQGQVERIGAVMLIGLIRQTQLFSYFDVIRRGGHQIKDCPAVTFPCCLDKESETRSALYPRCDVGKLGWYLLCSIPELTSKHQRVSLLPAEHAGFP